MADPTADEGARLVQAVTAKATRILVLVGAPLGAWGEVTDMGQASVKPDYQIRELLYGMHYAGFDVDAATTGVTAEMVIRHGLETDPATYPADRLDDVERAIAAARSWVATDLAGFGAA